MAVGDDMTGPPSTANEQERTFLKSLSARSRTVREVEARVRTQALLCVILSSSPALVMQY